MTKPMRPTKISSNILNTTQFSKAINLSAIDIIIFMTTILLLVHIGPILPPYLRDCILQLRRFTQIETHILVQQPHIEEVNRWAVPNIKAIPLETVPFSDKHIEFAKKSRHNAHFRNGFWRFASERFSLFMIMHYKIV